MTFPKLFEGPSSTLFHLDAHGVRIIFREEEAHVSVRELLAFLLHLTLHHAALVSLTAPERLSSRLHSLLVAWHE